jgi:hypothetical protein
MLSIVFFNIKNQLIDKRYAKKYSEYKELISETVQFDK